MAELSFQYDHVHLRTRDKQGTMSFYEKVFGATRVVSEENGTRREYLEIAGVNLFFADASSAPELPSAPTRPYIGLDHIGFRVDDVDATIEELRGRGAIIFTEPKTIGSGARIAFVQGPDGVRIEIIRREPA